MNNMSESTNENIEIVLLGFLCNKPMHGYDLYKDISNPNGIGSVYRIKIGKMYSILKKLEKEKLINSSIQKEGNRPQKSILELTRKGKSVFNDWLNSPIQHGRDFRILFLLKLFFINQNNTINTSKLLLKQKQECQKWEERINSLIDQQDPGDIFHQMVTQYRLTQIEGYSKWLEWCERKINEKNIS